ncbi:uncharacterized protein LOC122064825 [Macadamia integrifolia]|uniref:uncharacterized protein LOC122064825 n=1 Tax=Macadamia integrifolia TaxID=60698 RepID=UPI001C4FD614|nr:uncharacterized protein LOC122064825 [Macadamia integrifolia]
MAQLLWQIWLSYNELIRNRASVNIDVVIRKSQPLAFNHIPNTRSNYSMVLRHIAWDLPYLFIKINMDGSSLGASGLSGSSGVFRDHSGNFLCEFADFLGITYAYISETLAIRIALQIARSKNFSHILIESDFLSVINILNGNSNSIPWRISHIILYCLNLSQSFSVVLFRHAFCQANSVANRFASFGSSHRYSIVWNHSPPPFASLALFYDLCNISLSHE